MTNNFYADIQGFPNFSEACKSENYHVVPSDWVVVVADVIASTNAIQSGRYKDVNMAGAACIAAVINNCEDYHIPFVFGGDGATFLIPEHLSPIVEVQLQAVKQSVKENHQLDLRVGLVPIAEIEKRGKIFKVAKYQTDTGCSLAMFAGGGATLAETLVKSGEYNLDDSKEISEPNLSGLSCRWHPIEPKHDSILTLLINARDDDPDHKIYSEVNSKIVKILDDSGCPIHIENMKYKWPGKETMRQSKMVWNQGNIFKNIAEHMFLISLFNIFQRFGWNVGPLEMKTYEKDMEENSDYRKFDDMLRMVIDCTNEQSDKLIKYLDKMSEEGHIDYGTHKSKTALMTCFLTSFERDGHIHFIDGNDGGYALAAQDLKQKMENQRAA